MFSMFFLIIFHIFSSHVKIRGHITALKCVNWRDCFSGDRRTSVSGINSPEPPAPEAAASPSPSCASPGSPAGTPSCAAAPASWDKRQQVFFLFVFFFFNDSFCYSLLLPPTTTSFKTLPELPQFALVGLRKCHVRVVGLGPLGNHPLQLLLPLPLLLPPALLLLLCLLPLLQHLSARGGGVHQVGVKG